MISMSSLGPFCVLHVASVLLLPPTVETQWWCHTNVTEEALAGARSFVRKAHSTQGH